MAKGCLAHGGGRVGKERWQSASDPVEGLRIHASRRPWRCCCAGRRVQFRKVAAEFWTEAPPPLRPELSVKSQSTIEGLAPVTERPAFAGCGNCETVKERAVVPAAACGARRRSCCRRTDAAA